MGSSHSNNFNPLDYPLCLTYPLRFATTTWSSHIPFALFLVEVLRPQMIVELGTFTGVSYCALCQAVKELKLETRCYAIDTWQGDAQTGFYNSSVLQDLREHHDPLYQDFSSLIQSTFDEALPHFAEGSIDLLHIDGFHTYEAAQHDFESWLPKMSERGVIILHDINVRERDFGVWKLWEEIKRRFQHFEFMHEYGLGVVTTGGFAPVALRQVIESSEAEAAKIRQFFFQLGQRLKLRLERDQERDLLSERILQQERSLNALSAQVEQHQFAIESVSAQLVEKDHIIDSLGSQLIEKDHAIDSLGSQLIEKDRITDSLGSQLIEKDRAITSIGSHLTEKEARLNSILNSRAWRWVNRYGRIKNRLLPLTHERLVRSLPGNGSQAQADWDIYQRWVKDYDTLTDADREAIAKRIEGLSDCPLISIVMPVYNVDERWLRRAIESVRRQLYTHWELCIADDHSSQPHVRRVLAEYAEKDSRIKVAFRNERGHISLASNSALELTSGEFVAFLDHDDELTEHALYLVAEELNDHPEADLIYSDEDKINEDGQRFHPHFKTDWNPDLFYSMNYISHFATYRAAIIKKLGGLRSGYEGSQDYDLVLRVVEQIPEEHIRHIPHVLYHWRAIKGSTSLGVNEKEYAHEIAREAIRAHFKRCGKSATVSAGFKTYHRVRHPLPASPPLVSLIIGTRDRVELLQQTIKGVLEQTGYCPIELIVVDNQSRELETLAYLRQLEADARVKVIQYDAPFNYSVINNLAAQHAEGQVIGLINNDIKVISSGWLEEMVSHALRPEIGAVGAKLCYPDNRIQHAGVILGVGGLAGHAYKFLPKQNSIYFGRAHLVQNYSAVTGACLILRREIFDEVGGLDEVNLPVAFNDVDFCLRIRERGYRILWTPYAELYHLESASRGLDDTFEKQERFLHECDYMLARWGPLLKSDPYYNPNLSLQAEDFSLSFPPRAFKPWQEKLLA